MPALPGTVNHSMNGHMNGHYAQGHSQDPYISSSSTSKTASPGFQNGDNVRASSQVFLTSETKERSLQEAVNSGMVKNCEPRRKETTVNFINELRDFWRVS